MTLGTVAVLLAATFLYLRSLWQIHIDTADFDELVASVGLNATPLPSTEVVPFEQLKTITHVAGSPGGLPWGITTASYHSDVEIGAHASDIMAARQITDRFESFSAGRGFDPSIIDISAIRQQCRALRQIMLLYAMQAQLALLHKDSATALNRLLKMLALERNATSTGNGETRQESRISIDELLFRSIIAAASRGLFTPAQLRELYASVEPGGAIDPVAQEYIREDLKETLRVLTTIKSADDLHGLTDQAMLTPSQQATLLSGELDVRATAALAHKFANILLANVANPWNNQDGSIPTSIEALSKMIPGIPPSDDNGEIDFLRKLKYKWALVHTPNVLGIWTLLILQDTGFGLVRQSFAYRARRDATREIIAIALYRKLHAGAFPKSLDALKRLGLSGPVPKDSFSDSAFRYDSARRLLWSIGPNTKDDHGKTGAPWWNGPDIAWNIG